MPLPTGNQPSRSGRISRPFVSFRPIRAVRRVGDYPVGFPTPRLARHHVAQGGTSRDIWGRALALYRGRFVSRDDDTCTSHAGKTCCDVVSHGDSTPISALG
jgi:hypothetical protein